MYELLNASFQGVTRLFVLTYVIAAGAANYEADIKTIESIFLQEGRLIIITHWLMEEIFCDQPTNDMIKQYDEVWKVPIW